MEVEQIVEKLRFYSEELPKEALEKAKTILLRAENIQNLRDKEVVFERL